MKITNVCLAAALLTGVAACADPAQQTPATVADVAVQEAGGDAASLFDTAKPDGAPVDGTGDSATDAGPSVDEIAPGAFVWLTFEVDDSANKTFKDTEIRWTGSFKWDEATNTVVYSTSWLPEEGPYPPLYDDGPTAEGGHERDGAKKGDALFSTQVRYVAPTDADTEFDYGALNEFDNWMWVGPNGKLSVPKGATGALAAKGLVLKPFGPRDLKLTLDTKALDPAFAKWSTATHKFWVKGTLNQWTAVQLLDDGQKGDAAKGDGILTYVHKQSLVKHTGGMLEGEEVQFVFLTTTGDAAPSAGLEYKGGKEAYSAGVSAWTDTGPAGAWAPTPVVLAVDSKGKFKNTAVVVPAAASGCTPACAADKVCVAGACVAKSCAAACASDQVCSAGMCVAKPCSPTCGSGEACEGGVCVKKGGCQPPCASGSSCVNDKCVVAAPAGPTFTAVVPAFAPAKGGGSVLLVGDELPATATVTFVSTAEAKTSAAGTQVAVVAGKGVSVVVPALPALPAHVTVSIPGKAPLTLSNALYLVPIDTPVVDGAMGADWHASTLAAVNQIETAWGVGKNQVTSARLSYDKDNLYIGIEGVVESGNAIVVYLDVDGDAGTGVQGAVDLKDNAGAVDDAIAGVLKFTAEFGADCAFATLGMGTFEGTDLAKSTAAGWRSLANINDFGWLLGTIKTAPATATLGATLEASMPLATLYPNGIPTAGVALRWVAVVVNKDGLSVSNQFLPMQTAPPDAKTAVSFGKLQVFAVP